MGVNKLSVFSDSLPHRLITDDEIDLRQVQYLLRFLISLNKYTCTDLEDVCFAACVGFNWVVHDYGYEIIERSY